MKSILTALLIALSVSSANAVSPSYYSCEGSDFSTQFFVYNNGNDLIVANDAYHYPAKYFTIYSGAGDEIYEKVFTTSEVNKNIIDSSVHAIGVTQAIMEGKAKTATVRLLTYNDGPYKAIVVRSINVPCRRVDAR